MQLAFYNFSMIRSVKSQARFPLNWTPYFTHCPRLSVNQLETRSEKLSPSILTRGSSQSEEGRGRIEKNLFSARELSPHLRNCDKFTSAQKEPIRARHNARLRAQPREKRQTQRKLIDVNVASNLRLQHTLWDFAKYKMQTNTKHKKG